MVIEPSSCQVPMLKHTYQLRACIFWRDLYRISLLYVRGMVLQWMGSVYLGDCVYGRSDTVTVHPLFKTRFSPSNATGCKPHYDRTIHHHCGLPFLNCLLGSPMLQGTGQSHHWPTNGRIGYVTPAVFGVPNASEQETKSEIAHKWSKSQRALEQTQTEAPSIPWMRFAANTVCVRAVLAVGAAGWMGHQQQREPGIYMKGVSV